jgi:hypothetical protein
MDELPKDLFQAALGPYLTLVEIWETRLVCWRWKRLMDHLFLAQFAARLRRRQEELGLGSFHLGLLTEQEYGKRAYIVGSIILSTLHDTAWEGQDMDVFCDLRRRDIWNPPPAKEPHPAPVNLPGFHAERRPSSAQAKARGDTALLEEIDDETLYSDENYVIDRFIVRRDEDQVKVLDICLVNRASPELFYDKFDIGGCASCFDGKTLVIQDIQKTMRKVLQQLGGTSCARTMKYKDRGFTVEKGEALQ